MVALIRVLLILTVVSLTLTGCAILLKKQFPELFVKRPKQITRKYPDQTRYRIEHEMDLWRYAGHADNCQQCQEQLHGR